MITTTQRLVESRCDITFGTAFLEEKYSLQVLQYLETNVKWSKAITKGRRVNANYGDPGVVYELNIRGNTIRREVQPWTTLPFLKDLKDFVEQATKCKYNYVVLQRYPGPTVGMKPHRDKEMVKGTTITGLSLGATRVLTITNPYTHKTHQFQLATGSIYMLNPPTNEYCTHSIEPGTVEGVRISLTFRMMPMEAPRISAAPTLLPLPSA